MKSTLLGIVFVTAGIVAGSPAMSQDFKSQAQASADKWDQGFNKGDAAMIAQAYTKTAHILPAGGPLVMGSDGAEKFFADVLKKEFKNHKITVEGGETKGDLGFAYGKWQATGPGPDGQPKTYGGHWTNVMEKDGGQWKTVLHTWN